MSAEQVVDSLSAAGGQHLDVEELTFDPDARRPASNRLTLGGGMGALDTFDPKRVGDPKEKVAGSYYESIETAAEGVRVCEHLKQLAPLMDRVTALRTVNHNVIDEHAAATNFMHIGRPVSGGKLEVFLAENCGLTQQTTRAVQIYDATSFGDEPTSL